MQQSKLIEHLKLLNAEEFKRFYVFLQSPYYTQSKDVIRLFKLIRKYHPSFLSKHLMKENIFKKLFPNEAYSDIKLRNLQSKLNKVIEAYFIQISYEKDNYGKRKLIASFYSNRNFISGHNSLIQSLLSEVESLKSRDSTYFFQLYKLHFSNFFNGGYLKKQERVDHLNSACDNFQFYYLLENEKLNLIKRNRIKIYAPKREEKRFNLLEKNVVYQLYQRLNQLFEQYDYKKYSTAKNYFLEGKELLRKEDAQNILILLVNLLGKNEINRGKEMIVEVFELYKLGIETKILLSEGKLHENLYLNIIIQGASLKKFDWLDSFINEYSNKLIGTNQKDILNLGMAYYYFNKEFFGDTIRLIATYKFKEKLIELPARNLSIRSHFELFLKDNSYHLYFEHSLDAFYKFLKRDNQFSHSKIKPYLNLLKVIKKIGEVYISDEKNSKVILFNYLQSHQPVIALYWLRKKIEVI